MKFAVFLSLLAFSVQAHAARIQLADQPPAKFETDLIGNPTATVTSLSGLTEIRYDAANSSNLRSGSTQYVLLDNVRATSSTTVLDDYLRIKELASNNTFNLSTNQIQIFKNIGIYEPSEGIFIKDAYAAITMIFGGSFFYADTNYTFNSQNGASPLAFNVSTCSSLGVYLRNISAPIKVALTTTSTAPAESSYTRVSAFSSGALSWYLSRLGTLQSTKAYLWIKPISTSTVNYTFSYTNENSTKIITVNNNQTKST